MTKACHLNNLEHVEILWRAGAMINAETRRGRTPLIESCKNGHTDVVKQVCVVSPIFTNKPSNTTAQAHQLGK